jgi:putative DNA primase/helicase
MSVMTDDGDRPLPAAEIMKDIRNKRARFRAIDGGGDSATSAPAPHQLPESLLPVAAFEPDLMPRELRPLVQDVAERMQCPADYIAVSFMVGAGTLIGRNVAMRPMLHDDWTVIANQWACLVGRPGVMKSPAMRAALEPLMRLEGMAEQQFNTEKAKYELKSQVMKIRAEVIKDSARKLLRKNSGAKVDDMLEIAAEAIEPEPTRKRYVFNDTTVESAGVLLQQNTNGLLGFRDELMSMLDSLDQEEHASQRGFYLSGWNGDGSYTFDRIGRGLHLTIPAVCISILGSTQPSRISEYLHRAVNGGRGDDGLIQRFGMMVWPDIARDWTLIDRAPDPAARKAAHDVFARLDKLDWRAVKARKDRDQSGEEDGFAYLRFDAEAYQRFVGWRTELERRLRTGDLQPALESHLAKYRKLVPGIALICHLVDGGTGPVTDASAARAIRWATYLETHARRAYASVTVVAADSARAILEKIWAGKLKAEFTCKDVWRPQWSKLSDRKLVQAGLDLLEDYDWLVAKRVETKGRPSVMYTLSSHPGAAKPQGGAQ